MSSSSCERAMARRRRRLSIDYHDLTQTWLYGHSGQACGPGMIMSHCLKTVRRQFLSHYFGFPPRWRIWLRQLQKERALPDFCIIGPTKFGSSDLAITIMSHPNVLHPLAKELHTTDPLTWKPYYPTLKKIARHTRTHGLTMCPLVAPYLHVPEIPVTLSSIRPDAKIVIILRNPPDLVFSLWKWSVLHREKQLVDRVPFLATFSAYVDKALEMFHDAPGPLASTLHPAIYATSVACWLQAFGGSNVRVFDVAEYFNDRNVLLRRLESFLGLPHVQLPQRLPIANRNPLDHLKPDPGASAKLQRFFEPYNRRLWEVIGTRYSW